MIYTLKNDFLKVEIADMGAELMSVRSKDGCEYLWQGDDRYWASRAPWMFPVCGRLPAAGTPTTARNTSCPTTALPAAPSLR